jgi:hypothetical protein
VSPNKSGFDKQFMQSIKKNYAFFIDFAEGEGAQKKKKFFFYYLHGTIVCILHNE